MSLFRLASDHTHDPPLGPVNSTLFTPPPLRHHGNHDSMDQDTSRAVTREFVGDDENVTAVRREGHRANHAKTLGVGATAT